MNKSYIDEIPKRTKKSIDDYVEEGTPPGSFVRTVLRNDLARSFAKADKQNLESLHSIVKYIWNELPMKVWGSEKKVKQWIEKKKKEASGNE